MGRERPTQPRRTKRDLSKKKKKTLARLEVSHLFQQREQKKKMDCLCWSLVGGESLEIEAPPQLFSPFFSPNETLRCGIREGEKTCLDTRDGVQRIVRAVESYGVRSGGRRGGKSSQKKKKMFQQNKKDPKTVRRDINGVKKKERDRSSTLERSPIKTRGVIQKLPHTKLKTTLNESHLEKEKQSELSNS